MKILLSVGCCFIGFDPHVRLLCGQVVDLSLDSNLIHVFFALFAIPNFVTLDVSAELNMEYDSFGSLQKCKLESILFVIVRSVQDLRKANLWL